MAGMPAQRKAPGRTLTEWLTYIETVHRRSIDMSLDRIRDVLRRMVSPWPSYSVVSVAGTNGKGSSVALLDAILRATGCSVGRYTSPHLVHYRERICINGQPMTDADLCAAFTTIEQARGDIPLTYFEFSTLAALLLFEQRGVDIAILEVGMGGRLDAVNVMDAEVALITNIAVDHVEWLGATRERIAAEKAGIMRTERPVVCVDTAPPKNIARLAREVGARLFQLQRHFGFAVGNRDWDWWGPDRQLAGLPCPNLVGEIQIQNAAGVLMVLECLASHLSVDRDAVERGLRSVQLRGRFQIVDGRPQVVLDVAHNPAAARVLLRNLARVPAKGQTFAVCGMMRDKQVKDVAAILAGEIDGWFIGSIDDSRGAPASHVANQVELGLRSVGKLARITEYASVAQAFARARACVSEHDRILVFGSFHTVGDILRFVS